MKTTILWISQISTQTSQVRIICTNLRIYSWKCKTKDSLNINRLLNNQSAQRVRNKKWRTRSVEYRRKSMNNRRKKKWCKLKLQSPTCWVCISWGSHLGICRAMCQDSNLTRMTWSLKYLQLRGNSTSQRRFNFCLTSKMAHKQKIILLTFLIKLLNQTSTKTHNRRAGMNMKNSLRSRTKAWGLTKIQSRETVWAMNHTFLKNLQYISSLLLKTRLNIKKTTQIHKRNILKWIFVNLWQFTFRKSSHKITNRLPRWAGMNPISA